jgi:ABC-type cobalamin/Fe3+-siderophores transport system ATPase subunit
MIIEMNVKEFRGISYLESSNLMKRHKGRLAFASDKPNVLVGPNGAGKSAVMQTLALRFLAYFSGASTFDDKYLRDSEADAWWTKEVYWRDNAEWLKGLKCKTDNGPALYYRPGHIPGNECSITHSMMMGYFEQAKAYGMLVKDKSSGQQSQAVLQRILDALAGRELPTDYAQLNWPYGRKLKEAGGQGHPGHFAPQAEALKKCYPPDTVGIPLILMDEPEQSLDARAEGQLWNAIAHADCSRMQVIVATHSLYPLLHRDKFNLIESEPGFIKDVLALMA